MVCLMSSSQAKCCFGVPLNLRKCVEGKGVSNPEAFFVKYAAPINLANAWKPASPVSARVPFSQIKEEYLKNILANVTLPMLLKKEV